MRDGLIAELPWPWNHQVIGAGSLTSAITGLPEVLVIVGTRAVGGSEMLAQRLLFAAIFAATAWGVSRFCRAVGANSSAALLGGLLGAFNPYVLSRLPNVLPLVAIALAGALGAEIVAAASGRSTRPVALALMSVGACYLALNPPLLAVLCAWVLALVLMGNAWGGHGGRSRALRFATRAMPLAVVLNLWWAAPFIMSLLSNSGTAIGASSDVRGWAWTHRRSSLINVATLRSSWAWVPSNRPYVGVMDGVPVGGLAFAFPALAVAAPLVARGRDRRLAIAMVAICGALIAVGQGLHPPFGRANLWLFDHVPGMWLLREPDAKLGAIRVVLYAALAAVTFTSLPHSRFLKAKRRWTPGWRQAVGAIAVFSVAYPYPLWTGDILPDNPSRRSSPHVTLPAAWRDAAAFINDSPPVGKVLVLPLRDYYQMPTTWGYYGADSIARSLFKRPSLTREAGGYFTPSESLNELLDAVESSLISGNVDAVPPLLSALGISDVVLRHDFDRASPGRSFADSRTLARGLAGIPGVRRVAAFGLLDVYRFTGGRLAYTVPPLLASRGEGSADVSTILAASNGSVVVTEEVPSPYTQVPVAVHATKEGGPADLPIPSAGDYEISRFPDGDPVYAVRLVTESDRTSLEFAKVDEVAVADQPLVPSSPQLVSVPASAVAVTVGETLLDLRTMAPGVNPAFVRVGTATRVAVFDERGSGASQLGSFGAVGNCHRHDDRSEEELGLAAEKIPAQQGGGVRLTARAHAACVSVPINDFDPSAAYVVRLRYRTVEGRTARLCVWQEGPNRCATLPELTPSTEFSALDAVIVPEQGTTALRLFLYADGPDDGRRTVTEYQDIAVTRAHVAWEDMLSATRNRTQTVRLPAGDVSVTVAPPIPGELRGPLSAVGDCARSDRRTHAEVGIRADMLGEGNVRLHAQAHSACVSATVAPFSDAVWYRVSFDHRGLSGQPPRLCIWQEGPDSCASIQQPATEPDNLWHTYEVTVRPQPGTMGLRLFLYADGRQGAPPTAVEYRRVSVRSVAAVKIVALAAATSATQAPALTTTSPHPGRFDVLVRDAPAAFVLVVPESYAPGWKLKGLPSGVRAKHLRVNGYANGWVIEGAKGDLSIDAVYGPSRWPLAALAASTVAIVVLLTLGVLRRLRRRHADRVRLAVTAAVTHTEPGRE